MPSIKTLCAATGISPSYASMIRRDQRDPAPALAIKIYRATGWKTKPIAKLNDEEIDALEGILERQGMAA